MKKKSGKDWVTWANSNATNSTELNTLKQPFRDNLAAFIKALEEAGATVKIKSSLRSKKRAYLFHWSWKIYLKKCKPQDPLEMDGIGIEWDHGNEEESIKGAKEMVVGFGLAVPPASNVAPALESNHNSGLACDLKIRWNGAIEIKKKDGIKVKVTYYENTNLNLELHKVGKTYGVLKLTTDEPHWSHNGH